MVKHGYNPVNKKKYGGAKIRHIHPHTTTTHDGMSRVTKRTKGDLWIF